MTSLSTQKYGVFGLGRAGNAAVAMLQAAGAEVYSDDDASDTTTHHSEWPWHELSGLILSPGVPLTHPKPHPVVNAAQTANVPILGDVELLFSVYPTAKYVGITGTNGKSTTTALVQHMCEQLSIKSAVGGNLGTPAAELALQPAQDVYVLEMSSYQLDLLRQTRFHIAALLNITPDHLDRHGDMDGYMMAKMHIFDRQTPEDHAIIAVDDDNTRLLAANIAGRNTLKVSAQQQAPVWIDDNSVLHDGVAKFPLELPASLRGSHNRQNVVVAYSILRALGQPADNIIAALPSFGGLPHRMEQVGTIGPVEFINDSKATNADAAAKSLATFNDIYWIVGGVPKAGGIDSLEPYFDRIKHAFLIGEAADAFATTLSGKVASTKCGTLEAATRAAYQLATKNGGGTVLLAPACASFDQFASFEARGDAFSAMVKNAS